MRLFCGEKTVTLSDTHFEVFDIKRFINFLDSKTTYEIRYRQSDLELIRKNLNYVEAAGGLVYNHRNELLVIERFGLPDLPKGKIEKKESPEHAAIREVAEECGIHTHEIVTPLQSSFHIYPHKGFYTLKKTYWFSMRYAGNEPLIPQTSEDITAVYWADRLKRHQLAEQTYPNLKSYFML